MKGWKRMDTTRIIKPEDRIRAELEELRWLRDVVTMSRDMVKGQQADLNMRVYWITKISNEIGVLQRKLHKITHPECYEDNN